MPENLPNPILLNYTGTIKTEQLTAPFTFPHTPCRDWEEFEERGYKISFFPIKKKKNIASVPKFSSLLTGFSKPFLVAHTPGSVTGQLEKVIYELAKQLQMPKFPSQGC